METACPMVDRENELEHLMSQMARSFSGEGGLVLVSGEAGSGKTTLCEEFDKLAVKSGCLVLVGRCVPASQSPYLPFMEAFFNQVPNPFAISGESFSVNTGKLLLSILDSVEQLSKDRALVLWLEDLHWADSASIALVHFLARNVRTLKVLLLGTYRPEEIHSASSGELHPLKESLRIMRREGICTELELKLLDPSATKQIVPPRLGGMAEEPLLALVADESKGNPLFAVEMVRFLMSSGQVMCKDGIWRLQRKMKIQTPSTIREVILARTEHIPREAKQVLECASVIGEWFEPEMIEESLSINRMRLLDELEALEKEHQLVREDEGRYKFSHEKIRQVVYEQISSHRRKELHRSVGLLLEKRLPNDELLGPLSYHFDEADDNGKCIKYSLSAGEYCYRRKAIREAKSYFQLVLKRTDGDKGFIAERLEALEGLGDLGFAASTARELYSYYERFLELNRDRKARSRALAKSAECWDQIGLADTKKANELLDEAESIADGDPSILAIIEFHRAELSSNDGKRNDARAHLVNARSHYRQVGDSAGIVMCGVLEVVVARQAYRYAEAQALARELLVFTKNLGDPELLCEVENQNANVCARTGDVGLARTYATEGIELANKIGDITGWRRNLINRARALELEGNLELARPDISVALENAKEFEMPYHVAYCEINLGLIEAELGYLESAQLHYEEGLKKASVLPSGLGFDPNPAVLKAEIQARLGAIQQSDELYEEMIRYNVESSQLFELVNCRSRYGMSLARRGMSEKARKQFDAAMHVAEKIGCEKRVQAFAKRAGIAL